MAPLAGALPGTTGTMQAAMLKHTAGGQLIPPDKHVATSRTTHLSTFKSHSPWPGSQLCSSALSMKGGDASPARTLLAPSVLCLSRLLSFLSLLL